MKTANQRPIIKSQSAQQSSTDAGRLRSLSIVSSALLFGTLSFSAHAGSLFSSTEYLDYQLPKKVQESCTARDNCPEIEVKYLNTNHKWINDITNQRINTLVLIVNRLNLRLSLPRPLQPLSKARLMVLSPRNLMSYRVTVHLPTA